MPFVSYSIFHIPYSRAFKLALINILFFISLGFAQHLDIRVLRVEFLYEETDNSLTTGRGTFNSDIKDYKLDPKGERGSEVYWKSHLNFAENYFKKASGGDVSFDTEVFPKDKNAYKLQKHIIDYNRTSRRSGEKMEAFDSARAADYARFVNDVLVLAKEDNVGNPLAPSVFGKRVILIAHAGANRLIDGGTLGTRGADTPGDFNDTYIDTTWKINDTTWIWKGFEVSAGDELSGGDTIRSVMVTSETASQDGLNWGINGTITSQIGRELGLPYSFDVVKGFSRLGYFDGMDYAGYNAGNGFFPSLPSAWMRAYKGWGSVKEISQSSKEKRTVEICAAGCECDNSPQIVKIPINSNEYILLENRQRTCGTDGKISAEMSNRGIRETVEIPVDSLNSYFLNEDKDKQKYSGVIEYINEVDAALPASGIVAWHVNDWYIRELIPFGAINAWNGDTFRDHQFGISLLEADGILGLGKEFKNAAGEPAYYFGSGSDLIPHKKFNKTKQFNTQFSIDSAGYTNTASTFGGYSGLKITAKIPDDAQVEKSFNGLTGDSVITWRALKIPVEIEWVGQYIKPVAKDELPFDFPAEKNFEQAQISEMNLDKFKDKSYNTCRKEKGVNVCETILPIYADINNDGVEEIIFLGNNRLYVVDTNGVPLPNFPVLLSNGEPLTDFNSKPMAIDIDGDGLLEVLIPANNGLLLAVNNKGKLLKEEFPVAAGTFAYEDSTRTKFPMLLYKQNHKDSIFLFAMHRGNINAFYLPSAKEFEGAEAKETTPKDEITEFFIYPNPIRGGKASMRFRILAPASNASLEVFDITRRKVLSNNIPNVNFGSNQIEGLDFSKLGSDIYSARLTVKFASGKRVEKWVRIGVIR